MTDRTIKPEEIVEGDRLTLDAEVIKCDRHTVSIDFPHGPRVLITREALAAATITRHEREPQVGDVGKRAGADETIYEVVGPPRTYSLGAREIALWSHETGYVEEHADRFHVTKRAGQ